MNSETGSSPNIHFKGAVLNKILSSAAWIIRLTFNIDSPLCVYCSNDSTYSGFHHNSSERCTHRRSQDFCLGGGTRPTPPRLASVVHTFEAVAGSWRSASTPAVSRVMSGAPERKNSKTIGEMTFGGGFV